MLKTNNNITQTGLRILFVLQLLIKGPISKAQILEKIASNPNIKNVAQDTITLDINTLKAAGFDIKTGNKSNNYCYELKLSPIKIKLTKKEMRALSIAKKAMFYFMDFRYIVSVFTTFEKISKLIENKEHAEELLNFGNFLKIDFKILKELDTHAKRKNEIVVVYNSPSSLKKELKIKCMELKYSKKTDKIHLWCKCDKYKDISYLRVDKIERIVKITKINNEPEIEPRECVYTVFRAPDSVFEFEDYEKVIAVSPSCITIKARYLNEFNLVQRLLSFGENLSGIECKHIRDIVLHNLSQIEEMYQ